MVGTRKSNADAHPGHVVLMSQQPRRSKEKITADEASAKAKAVAIKEAAAARQRAVAARIAELENIENQEEKVRQQNRKRPDLRRNVAMTRELTLKLPQVDEESDSDPT